MTLSNRPIYKKAHYFLQVGTKHVVSTELQILNCKDGGSWFGDQQLSTVIANLEGELMARIDQKQNDMDLQIVEDETLLMVYKFRLTGAKESVLLHKNQMEAMGLIEKVTSYGDGDYTYFILFPEKLTVTVSSIEQSEELLNLTEANLEAEDLGSKYFDDLKKITRSEKRRKETLKKIWNTRNRLNFKKGSPIVSTPVPSQCLKTQKTEKQKLLSFKEKISAFEHEKINKKVPIEASKDIPSCSKVETQTNILDFCTDSSNENQLPSTEHTRQNPAASDRLVSKTADDTAIPAVETTSQQQEQQYANADSSVVEISQSPPHHAEELPGKTTTNTHRLPCSKKDMNADGLYGEKNMNAEGEKSTNAEEPCDDKTTNADCNEVGEPFSDSDDFLTDKVTKRKRRRVIKVSYTKKKKSKRGASAVTGNKKTKCEPAERHVNSDLEESQLSDVNKKTKEVKEGDAIADAISMDDLIREKVVDKTITPLQEIDTLIAEKTIDLEEYGNVSLEDVGSVKDLSTNQVRDLVRGMEEELRAILHGETECARHKLYKEGGRGKGCLSMQVAFGLFSEAQEESITKTLVDIFCSRKSKYFDYTMKVLLPEAMAMLYAKVENISREEADKLIMERC